jgi:hypothetical protein
MPRRSRTHPLPATAAKEPPRLRPRAIDAARERYMSVIADFRKLTGETNAFVDKAHRLLTSHWAGSSWAARARMLKTVDWLIRVGASTPAPQPQRQHG